VKQSPVHKRLRVCLQLPLWVVVLCCVEGRDCTYAEHTNNIRAHAQVSLIIHYDDHPALRDAHTHTTTTSPPRTSTRARARAHLALVGCSIAELLKVVQQVHEECARKARRHRLHRQNDLRKRQQKVVLHHGVDKLHGCGARKKQKERRGGGGIHCANVRHTSALARGAAFVMRSYDGAAGDAHGDTSRVGVT
jgi:hypothetical protein